MNKIHSCTQVKPAAAFSFLSLSRASQFLGCLWDGVGRPGWGLTPEPLAGSWSRRSHRLTHFHLLPGTAASAPVVSPCPAQEGPLCPPLGNRCPESSWGHCWRYPRSCHSAASTCHPPVTHPVTHVSPSCWPQAHGDRGQGQACAAHRDCHHGQEWRWMAQGHMCCPSCPALAHPSPDPPCLGGGDKDTVPLNSPTAREAGAGSWCRWGGGWSSGHPRSCPHSQCQHPPARLGRGQGATPCKTDG